MKTEMSPEKIKEFLDALEKKKVHYIVIAGVGLDGKRGYLTRPHQDLDVLCSKKDLPKVDEVLEELGYKGRRYNDLYKAFDDKGGKVDVGLVTFEDKEAVTYGRIAVTRFPKSLFEHPQRGHIDNVDFNVAPNELLKTWGEHSQKESDAEYAKSLSANEKEIKKIKRVLRNE
jgi:hypothetical protein